MFTTLIMIVSFHHSFYEAKQTKTPWCWALHCCIVEKVLFFGTEVIAWSKQCVHRFRSNVSNSSSGTFPHFFLANTVRKSAKFELLKRTTMGCIFFLSFFVWFYHLSGWFEQSEHRLKRNRHNRKQAKNWQFHPNSCLKWQARLKTGDFGTVGLIRLHGLVYPCLN